MAETTVKGSAPRKRGLWIQGAVCGAALTFAAPSALLMGVLLAPAVLCAVAEAGPQRGMVRAVTLCGLAACVNAMWRLWMAGGRMDAAVALMCDPATLILAWGVGACAWAACQVLPVIVRTVWDLREAARARSIETELARCREEWDLEDPK